MVNRLRTPAARTILTVLLWGIVTELAIVALGLITDRSLPALLHLGLLYLGSYVPLLFPVARQRLLDRRGG